MLETPALWVAVAAILPLMVLTAYFDLKVLKIPNWLVLAVLAVFLVCGPWGLPLDTFGWRILQGVIVLVIGFGLFAAGAIGGGDAKMAAALAPFILASDIVFVLITYAVVTLVLLAVLRLVMQLARHNETGWLAIDQMNKPARERVFPMGLIFAITVGIYLAYHAWLALA